MRGCWTRIPYIFLCSAVRNQRVQSNTCQNPPPQLSKIIFVTGSTDSNYLVCVKLGATKPPNKTSGETFAARFCASCSALKLLKRPSYAGYGYFCMQRVTEKVSLFGSMNLSRQSYRQRLQLQKLITYKFFVHSFLFPEELIFPSMKTVECMIEITESAFATNHLKLRTLM